MGTPVIIDFLRTPFTRASAPDSGKAPGALAHTEPVEWAATLSAALILSNDVNKSDIEKIILGCVHQEAEQGLNIARMTVLHPASGLPDTVAGITVDMFCASSLATIAIAKNSILAGEAKMILAGGVQSMSRVAPWNIMMSKAIYDGNARNFMNMGATAENLAERYQIDRATQEQFAADSHRKAASAQDRGNFQREIIPVGGVFRDDNVRPDAAPERMAGLKPAFKAGGTVTAATSSPITDGGSLVLLADEDYAKKEGLSVLARIVSYAESGLAPEIMGLGPVEATKKALERARLDIKDIDVIELNEAFAAQSLAVLEEFNRQGMAIDRSKLNIDGGAIALGHPLGATGARIVGHAAEILKRENKRYGLATLCVGGGQGAAMIIENPSYKP